MRRHQISQGAGNLSHGVDDGSTRILTDLFQGLIYVNSSNGGSTTQTMAAAEQIPCFDNS